MAQIGSYKNTKFSENQKFLVLDPSTGTTSLVLGSSLVDYITPNLGYVYAETTRVAAENTDYAIGSIIQTSGSTSIGDNFAATYLVVGAGEGDFPMINGNELLTIKGDEFLREQLISEDAGEGASLISMEGGPTVEEAVNNRVIRASASVYASDYGFSTSNTASENDTAFLNFVAACSEGDEAIIDGGEYEMSATGFEFSGAVTLKVRGQVYINLNATNSNDFLTFAWSAGKPYANHIKGMLTINANDTGGDTIVMRGINWSVDDRVVIRNAGRDGFVLRTSDSENWFIENFYINQLEIDGAQRNGLAYDLALKSSGSFINEGLIQSLEVREAGKGGNGTEVKYIVPENTYSANKISSIVYVKTNFDLRSASRTEPYCVSVDRASGATNGSTVEHQMFINGAWENVAGLIAGSAAVYVDPNTSANNWKFFDVFTSDLDSFFAGTALSQYFLLDRGGRLQTSTTQTSGNTSAWKIGKDTSRLSQLHVQSGDSGLVGNVDTSADDMIIEGAGNAGITILSPNSNSGRLIFGDADSAVRGQLVYSHADDSFTFVTNSNKTNKQDSDGNLAPGSTGQQDLGSESNRYNHAHLSRLKLADGISEPTTSSGWAFIYVDSGTGELRVKFGDGTIKTIVTDV